MTDMSIITNNNIEKKQPIAVTTTNDTAVASTPASTTNSIYDGTEKEVKVEENISLAIDKILEKVCEKYKKYGITVEQLKQNPVLKALCQSKEEALKVMTSEEKKEAIKAYEEAFDAAKATNSVASSWLKTLPFASFSERIVFKFAGSKVSAATACL